MKIEELFFELLRISVGADSEAIDATSPLSPLQRRGEVSDEEWAAVYELSKRQTVVGVFYSGIQSLPEEQRPPRKLLRQWAVKADKIVSMNRYATADSKLVYDRLYRDGFHSMVLKGQGNRAYYPENLRDYRVPGDVDVWVWPGMEEGMRDEGRGMRDEGRGVRDEGRGKSIIFVGYMDDNKAPDILLDAVSQLKAEGKLGEWKVTMMGNGDVERFAKMSEEMGLKDNVTFTGYITGKEKERNFSEASILVLCSYEEGFPMVVLEAWNYGISVISTPVGGLPDVVDEGKNCLTFPFGDSRALAQQLHKLMTDEKLRDDMGRYSKEFVDRTFSIDRISSDADAIYESLSL